MSEPKILFPKLLYPKILYEDNHLIVLSKPAGLLSQGEKTGDHNLVDWLRAYLKRNYVGLVHRLDRNTSGLMVIAKRTKSAQRLTTSLQEGKILRHYLGWAVGTLSKPTRWTHQLEKDERTNLVKVVQSGGKEAILMALPRAHGLWEQTPLTLIEFKLETGRSHQIRVQAAAEGLALLGDTKYGKSKSSFPRTALHSHYLVFPHPMTEEDMQFEDPLPLDMSEIKHS